MTAVLSFMFGKNVYLIFHVPNEKTVLSCRAAPDSCRGLPTDNNQFDVLLYTSLSALSSVFDTASNALSSECLVDFAFD
jgi:hypothetical protein